MDLHICPFPIWDLLTEISENLVSFLQFTIQFMLCSQGDQIGISARMFKALIGRGHSEFSTNRQQDAQEFLLHFINMVEVKLCSLCLTFRSTCFSITSLLPFVHSGTVALGPTHLKPSGSWWRKKLCVSSHKKPNTHSGWITSSSCLCLWTRPPTQVKGWWDTSSN